MSEINLAPFYDVLGYHFRDSALLRLALRHRSLGVQNNERLEFLGDSLLGMVISAELYAQYPDAKEGALSRMRSSLVSRPMLVKIANELTLGRYVMLSPGEIKTGGRRRNSILANTVEALIGAIYLDGGLEACRARILYWYQQRIAALSEVELPKDPKTQLQEWLQARKKPLPVYRVTVEGAAHAQTFYVTCTVDTMGEATHGSGRNRRDAEQAAALRFLALLS